MALCMSSFAVGGLTPEGFALAALGLAPLLWRERRGLRLTDTRDGQFAVLFAGAMIAVNLLTALPLPHVVLRFVSPQTAKIWGDALSPIGAHVQWHSISLEPFGSILDALKVVLYLAFFLAIRTVVRIPAGNVRVERALLCATCVLAVVALVHPAVGAERVFGLYKPENARGIRLTPLLNPNHLAAYLSPAILLAIQQAQDRKPSIHRAFSWSALAICSIAMAYAASRGGTLALAIGAVALVFTRRSGKQKISSASRWRALAALASTALLFVAVMTALPHISSELIDSDMTKAQIWRSAARLLPEFKAFGVGRGAFGSAIASVAGIMNNESPTHPENILLQLLTEYGWLLGGAAIAAGAWLLRPAMLARTERTAVWAYWAAATLVLHDMADYALEVPAVGMLMALLVARYLPTRQDVVPPVVRGERPPPVPLQRRLLWVGICVLGGVGLYVGQRAPARDLREAYNELSHGPLPRTRTQQLVERHPASPYAALIAALSEPKLGSDVAIAWSGRALALASSDGVPLYGRAHAVLAAHLRTRNPRQALLEYSHAMSDDNRLVNPVTPEILSSIRDHDDLSAVLPKEGLLRSDILANLWAPMSYRLPASLDIERRALGAVGDSDPRLLRARAVEAIYDARASSPWCGENSRTCATQALRALSLLQAKSSDVCEAPSLLLELVEGTPLYSRAAEAAEAAFARSDNRDACAQALLRSYAREHQTARFDAFAAMIRKWPCQADKSCVGVLLEAAQQDIQLGRNEKALAELHRIEREVSDAPAILDASANLAVKMGMHAEAAESYRRLSRRVAGRANEYLALADAEEALAKVKRLPPP